MDMMTPQSDLVHRLWAVADHEDGSHDAVRR